MLKLPSIKKQKEKISKYEVMQYLEMSKLPYSKLKTDFRYAVHMAAMDELDLRGAGGVLIHCHSKVDGLLAAAYLYKKYEEQHPQQYQIWDDEDFYEKYMEEIEQDEDSDTDTDVIRELLFDGTGLKRLPVISDFEFIRAYSMYDPTHHDFRPMQSRWHEESKPRIPYWVTGNYPLVVEGFGTTGQISPELISDKRFFIFIKVRTGWDSFMGGSGSIED